MNAVAQTFVFAWISTQLGSFLMLELGTRCASNRYLLRLGELALRQKLTALERIWPLTRIRPAIARGDVRTCTVILTTLIALKSAASLVFGVVMVFWLPVVSVMVPSIVAVHDPEDPGLGPWVRRVAGLQVTSHALLAALGFALFVAGPYADRALWSVLVANKLLVGLTSAASLVLAYLAGRAEASGIVERGI